MAKLFAPLTAAVMLVALCTALLRVRAELLLSLIEGGRGNSSTSAPAAHNDVGVEQALERAAGATLASAEAHQALARWYRQRASESHWSMEGRGSDGDGKVVNLCRALGELGASLRDRPFHSAALLNWANLRQLLGPVACAQPLSNGEVEPVIEFALAQDPTNPQILYGAALLRLWEGRKEMVLPLLHQVLLFDRRITQGQYHLMESLIESESDLRALVPARFPQVATMSARVRANNPVLYRSLAPTFAELQSAALLKTIEEYRRAQIDDAIYLSRLNSLSEIVSSYAVRQKLDDALAQYWGTHGQRPWADYLRQRANLNELAIVRAALSADTRPAKTPLSGWQALDPVHFDEFYTSVGFYLGEGQIAKSIELRSLGTANGLSANSIRLFVSNDNQDWIEDETRTIRSFITTGKPVMVIEPTTANYRYWKIHFSSAVRSRQFVNRLPELVRVFGRGRETSR